MHKLVYHKSRLERCMKYRCIDRLVFGLVAHLKLAVCSAKCWICEPFFICKICPFDSIWSRITKSFLHFSQLLLKISLINMHAWSWYWLNLVSLIKSIILAMICLAFGVSFIFTQIFSVYAAVILRQTWQPLYRHLLFRNSFYFSLAKTHKAALNICW